MTTQKIVLTAEPHRALSIALSKVEMVAIPDNENKAHYKDGVMTARGMVELLAKAQAKAVELYTHVAKMPTKEAAVAFVEGYAAQVEAYEKAAKAKGNADAKSDEQIVDKVANLKRRMSQVIRGTFGYVTRDKKTKKEKQVPGLGSTKAVLLLEGPGRVQDKLAKFPGSERSKSTADGNRGVVAVQRRIEAAGEVKVPTLGTLGAALGVPDKISKPRLIEDTLTTVIRAVPNNKVNVMLAAVVERLITHEDTRDLGITIRDFLVKEQIIAAPKSKERKLVRAPEAKPLATPQ